MSRSDVDPGLTKSRVGWVDSGRGIAIALVVVYHTAQWLAAPSFETSTWQQVNDGLATLRMPLFFTIAGLYAGKWIASGWPALWRSKLSLFTWVYGVWCVVATLPFMLGLNMQGQHGNYLWLYRALLTDPVRPRFELWFVWALGILFVVAKLSRRVPPSAQISIAAAASALAFSIVDLGNPGWNGLLRYAFFFLVGLYWRERIFRFGRWRNFPALMAIASLWVIMAVLGETTSANTLVGYYFVTALLGVGTGIIASRALQNVGWLSSMGRQTLPIYLSHTSVILLLVWCLHYLPAESRAAGPALLLVPLVAGVALVLSRSLFRVLGNRIGARLLFVQPHWWTELPVRLRLTDQSRGRQEQREGKRQEPNGAGRGAKG